MKICPKCGKVLAYNSYFGAYICADCNWEDASIGTKRNKGHITYKVSFQRNLDMIKKTKMLVSK